MTKLLVYWCKNCTLPQYRLFTKTKKGNQTGQARFKPTQSASSTYCQWFSSAQMMSSHRYIRDPLAVNKWVEYSRAAEPQQGPQAGTRQTKDNIPLRAQKDSQLYEPCDLSRTTFPIWLLYMRCWLRLGSSFEGLFTKLILPTCTAENKTLAGKAPILWSFQ